VIKKKLSRVQKKKEKKPKTIKNINTIAHLKAAPTHVISPYGWDYNLSKLLAKNGKQEPKQCYENGTQNQKAIEKPIQPA
jgi:hypothetical protein